MRYKIAYIDGHDLKYKTFECVASGEEDAVAKLRASYTNGDFDHQIISVTKIED